MTNIEFFEAYKSGQRHFTNVDFDEESDFSNKDFSNVIFENCFLYVDFRNTNLTNAKFIQCNSKEIDLRNSNLTNAYMTRCLVESVMFKGAIVTGFEFVDNYYFGMTIGQKEFNETIVNTDAYILKLSLSYADFLATMTPKMKDVTETSLPVIDIWPYYVKQLVYEDILRNYVYENRLVEKVYRNENNTFDQILLPTNNENTFVVIIIDIKRKAFSGFYVLDLSKEYAIE
ncbi:MAG TPA: pentapeptide repeat-containing protein [Chitinophagaceae bacterium]|nr:pentapeptide repeat-containing protein [Chitinophagaceae bacterium]